MARIKLSLPEKFIFQCTIPIRITDLNYGGHVGNDGILRLIHEARIQFLQHFGFSEMQFAGTGMLMADAAIEFKNELFFGDAVTIFVTTGIFSNVGFELYYKLEKQAGDEKKLVALAKTGMVCYDYQKKRVAAVPEEARQKFNA